MPAQYETVTEKVLVKEAGSKMEVSQAVYEKGTEQVLIKDASTRLETVPSIYGSSLDTIELDPATATWVQKKADKKTKLKNSKNNFIWDVDTIPAQYLVLSKFTRNGCPEGYQDDDAGCVKTFDIAAQYITKPILRIKQEATTKVIESPAQYETRTYQKLVSPATTIKTEVPAEYTTRTYQKLVSPATTKTIEVPAVYETRTYQKVKTATTTEKIEIPAEYKTRTFQKIKTPATTKSVDIPAEYEMLTTYKLVSPAKTSLVDVPAVYKTIRKKRLIKEGGISESKEVICKNKMTPELIGYIQKALRDAGYNPGPIDQVMGTLTKSALIQYQLENNLPIGHLDVETVKALTVN